MSVSIDELNLPIEEHIRELADAGERELYETEVMTQALLAATREAMEQTRRVCWAGLRGVVNATLGRLAPADIDEVPSDFNHHLTTYVIRIKPFGDVAMSVVFSLITGCDEWQFRWYRIPMRNEMIDKEPHEVDDSIQTVRSQNAALALCRRAEHLFKAAIPNQPSDHAQVSPA